MPGPADPLDNPVWHSLRGTHAPLAEGDDRALRYRPDVNGVAAVPDEPDGSHWSALAALAVGRPVAVYRRHLDVPAAWTVVESAPARQLLWGRADPPAATGLPVLELGPSDAGAMVELAEASGLGPFVPGALRLGPWVGLRDGGELVAMAGVRLSPPGHGEIATVCTRAGHGGRGYGAALTEAVAARILATGWRPVLHVFSANVGAVRLYERLGFVERMVGTFAVLTPPR
jgi:ribosomal protein S18 acetylase RimI-like enzyme